MFKFAVAQTQCVYLSKEENQRKILDIAEDAIEKGIDLIVFPEGVNLGYFLLEQDKGPEEKLDLALRIADDEDSEWTRGLSEMSRRGQIHIACGSFLKNSEGKLVNTLLLFSPVGQIHAYNKTHLFHTKGIEEKDFVVPGDGLGVFHSGHFSIGLSICYDLNFPEVFRTLALKGAQVILIASAWPAMAGDVWDTLLPARALENQVCVLASNQTGGEYYGHSKIVDCTGKVLAGMDREEGFVVAEVDLARQEKWRRIVTYFDDRRRDLYGL